MFSASHLVVSRDDSTFSLCDSSDCAESCVYGLPNLQYISGNANSDALSKHARHCVCSFSAAHDIRVCIFTRVDYCFARSFDMTGQVNKRL